MRAQVERGPLGWSTSRSLARRSSGVCWDTNSYYAALGIGYPYVHATMRDIRMAYLARGGPDDAYLTMIFTTFLDPVAKAVYDATPLGEKYLDEPERIGRKLADLAARQRGEIPDEEWVEAPLDNPLPGGEDGGHPAKGSPEGPYPFTILLWDTDTYNPWVLEDWQHLLLDAVERRGSGPKEIGLGVMENQGTHWIVGTVNQVHVVLLDRFFRPSSEAADRIVQAMS